MSVLVFHFLKYLINIHEIWYCGSKLKVLEEFYFGS
jgi:hypothetical protein